MSSPYPAPPRWRRRATRSWSLVWRLGFAVLVGGSAAAVQYGTAVDRVGSDGSDSVRLAALMALDLLAAPAALVLLAWRRHPAAGATVVLLSAFSALSAGAGALAVVSFAATQPARRVAGVGVAFTALATAASLLVPDSGFPLWAEALAVAVVYVLLVLVGLYVRNRRQLVASLQAQAQSTRREQEALRESARSGERARIAREMHDALGHRLSVIAMHAGALESRDDLSPDDTRMAAGVVRESAHQAMSELRQVLGVLNEASSTRPEGSDVPTLAQLPELVATGVGAEVVPSLCWEADVAAMPDTVSRHLYRIAQEALTNVRKHAPGQPTAVVVRRSTQDVVELVVRSHLAEPRPVARSAHVHHGLAGLAERARLAGGSLTAGPEDSEFVVRVVLPCQGMNPTRVVLVDDEQLIRAGLRLLLDGRDGIAVVGEASDGIEAGSVVAATPCDVVLMDVRMPRCDGVSATADIRKRPDAPPVLVLTTFDDDDLVIDALDAGAVGFLLKDTPPDELVVAVRAAAAGRQAFSPAVLDRLVEAARAHRSPSAGTAEADRLRATLTERERDVANAVADGLSNAQISAMLSMSLATVKTHLGRVFDKLGADNRVQVALRMRSVPHR